VCFSWDINLRWQHETDPDRTSEVDVTFTPEGPDRTHVVLTHRHLDRHGDGWEAMRDAVGSGWSLATFAEVARRTPTTEGTHVRGVALPAVSDEEVRERLSSP
jgi:hypothetical protein